MWWNGEGDDRVSKVFFGPNNGWCIFKEGGSISWDNLPDSLSDTIDAHWDEYDGVDDLSIGHNGEWFVKYGDGHFEWCGVHPALEAVFDLPSGKRGGVEWVELGPDGAFVALFEKYTCWYGSSDLTEKLIQA